MDQKQHPAARYMGDVEGERRGRAKNRGRPSARGLPSVFAAYDPAIEGRTGGGAAQWSGTPELPVQWSDFETVYLGHEGVRMFWRTWFAAWETVDFEYEEFIDAGDQVLCILSQRMRGRTSGVELEWSSYAQLWTIRDGKVIRVQFFANREEALEAARLSG